MKPCDDGEGVASDMNLGSRKDLGGVVADLKSQPTEGSNEIVERVAKAMWAKFNPSSSAENWNINRSQGAYMAMARAAIEALREPTWMMWDAAETAQMMLCDGLEHVKRTDPIAEDAFSFPTLRVWAGVVFWRAMIDEALGVDRLALPLEIFRSSERNERDLIPF